MKKYLALLACFIASSAIGQVVTYQAQGKMISTGFGPFKIGGAYTFDFSINESAPPTTDFGNFKAYNLGASSIKFNYEKGVYIGTADTAAVWISNSTFDSFSVGAALVGNVNFPAVNGKDYFNFGGNPVLDLFDPNGTALNSTALTDLSNLSQFLGGNNDRLILRWGNAESGLSMMVATVDSIEKISPNLSPVPEPSTYGLVGSLALFGLVARRIQRKRQAQTA